jgi:hypothetical protein
MLALFCPESDRSSKLRRIIVDVLLNGDPFTELLYHWCSGCCLNEEDCRQKMEVYLTAALVGHTPRPFDRSRWTDQEHSLRWVGLLEGNNRLFSQVYSRFADRLSRKPKHEAAVPDDGALHDLPAVVDGDLEDGHPGVPNFEGVPPVGEPEDEWEAKRREQSKYRQSVLDWISGLGPMSDVTILGIVVEILRKYTKRLLYLGGSDWEKKQQRAMVSLEGRADGHRPQQLYRVIIAATCEVELDVL